MTDDVTPLPDRAKESLYGSDDLIRDLLHECETWVVVGLGANSMRPAYSTAAFMQRHGKRIVPVHPRAEEVLGEPGYATVTEAVNAVRDSGGTVDVIDMFVNSSRVGDIIREVIDLKAAGVVAPRGIWLQLEVIDEAAAAKALDAGIAMVMDRCPAIEWPRLGPAA